MLSTYIYLYFTKTRHGGVIKRRTEEAPKHAGEKRVRRTPGTMEKTRWGEEGESEREERADAQIGLGRSATGQRAGASRSITATVK